MENPIIIIDNISKFYSLPGEGSLRNVKDIFSLNFFRKKKYNSHCALKNISLTINRGERVGVIGKNGAGKSTLLKIMSRISYPTEGKIRLRGTFTSLLEVGTGFNDSLTGRENIYLNASLHGLSHSEIEKSLDKIISFAEIEKFIDIPIKFYSSGMRMRLAFSVAAHLEQDILLLDEVLAVGDLSFQRKCLERVGELTSNGQTLFFVSHSMDLIARYCNRCIWIDDGELRMDGKVEDVISSYVKNISNVKKEVSFSSAVLNTKASQLKKNESSSGLNSPRESVILLSASILNGKRKKQDLFRTNEKIGIRMNYEINLPGMYLPAIYLYSPDGNLLFVSTVPDIDLKKFDKSKPSIITVTTWLPKNLLNLGKYTVSITVFDPTQAPFVKYFLQEHVLSFLCIESAIDTESSRGSMPRPFPGPIRPLLEWQFEENIKI